MNSNLCELVKTRVHLVKCKIHCGFFINWPLCTKSRHTSGTRSHKYLKYFHVIVAIPTQSYLVFLLCYRWLTLFFLEWLPGSTQLPSLCNSFQYQEQNQVVCSSHFLSCFVWRIWLVKLVSSWLVGWSVAGCWLVVVGGWLVVWNVVGWLVGW